MDQDNGPVFMRGWVLQWANVLASGGAPHGITDTVHRQAGIYSWPLGFTFFSQLEEFVFKHWMEMVVNGRRGIWWFVQIRTIMERSGLSALDDTPHSHFSCPKHNKLLFSDPCITFTVFFLAWRVPKRLNNDLLSYSTNERRDMWSTNCQVIVAVRDRLVYDWWHSLRI